MHDFLRYILQLLQRGIIFAVPVILVFAVVLAVIWLILRKKHRPMPVEKDRSVVCFVGLVCSDCVRHSIKGCPRVQAMEFSFFNGMERGLESVLASGVA